MRKKIVLLVAVVALLTPLAVSAQQGFSFMSFDIGGGVAIDINADDNDEMLLGLNSFGINFRLADPLILGVSWNNFSGAPGTGLTLFNIKYDITHLVRATLGFGMAGGFLSGDIYTGLGLELVPFRRQAGGLFSELKLALGYYFDPAGGLQEGLLFLGLALSVGF